MHPLLSEDIFTPQSYAAMSHVLASLVESAPPLELMDVTGIMVLGGQVGKKGGREGGRERGRVGAAPRRLELVHPLVYRLKR
jgi:hypothetical protein